MSTRSPRDRLCLVFCHNIMISFVVWFGGRTNGSFGCQAFLSLIMTASKHTLVSSQFLFDIIQNRYCIWGTVQIKSCGLGDLNHMHSLLTFNTDVHATLPWNKVVAAPSTAWVDKLFTHFAGCVVVIPSYRGWTLPFVKRIQTQDRNSWAEGGGEQQNMTMRPLNKVCNRVSFMISSWLKRLHLPCINSSTFVQRFY